MYSDNPGGFEYLYLDDVQSGFELTLRGTALWCGEPGAPYKKMRRVLFENGISGQRIKWRITHECEQGDYVRICIENRYGDRECSTYQVDRRN